MYALSFTQRRVWFLEQLGPEPLAFQLAAAVRLRGVPDLGALRQALDTLVARHQVLRTTFSAVDQVPRAHVQPPRPVDLRVVAAVSGDVVSGDVVSGNVMGRRVTAEIRRPFDLSRDLMLRASLVRPHDGDAVLVVVVHEMACDRFSLRQLLRELATLYEKLTTGEPSPLPEPDAPYADFARWQRHWLRGEVLELLLEYWKDRLGGTGAALQLPADRPRPPVQRFAGARCRWRLAGAHRGHGDLATASLAALKVLLFRYSGETHVRVGFPADPRRQKEHVGVVGPFAHPLVLQTALRGRLRFREALERTEATLADALAHRDLPFSLLLDALEPEPDLSHHPLFQVAFRIEEDEALPDLALLPIDAPAAQVDLTLVLTELGEDVAGFWEYDTDLFDAVTVGRIARHLETLLREAAADPECRLSDLPLLPAAERHQLAVEWNDSSEGAGGGTLFHHLFEARVDLAPDKVALYFEDEALTYRELNERANRLAHGLEGLGIGPEDRVGLCFDRGLEMIVAQLGVLKSGGAYVPLDPTYPEDRLAFMLHDSRAAVLLTEERHLERLPPPPGRSICLDRERSWLAGASAANPDSGVGPGNLAYAMYTSGSTGRPKGVLVTHRGLPNVSRAQRSTFGVGPEDRVLQFAALSYDASVWEVVMALASGAALQLAPSDALYPGAGLHRLLRDTRVTNITIAPTALAALPKEPLPDLRTLIVAGEECPADLVRRWSGNRSFWNAYGPTETTIWASVDACRAGEGKPSIGRPVANFDAYVVDRRCEAVPVGIAGELLLGGLSLARGYFERPALSAEKLVPHPFADAPGLRLYRTGDLARFLPDGRVAFLGRRDAQVKIRGFRIELEEIEAVLQEHPGLRETVVLAREDEPGRKRLVAYVVLDADQDVSVSELRRTLRERLPEFMVPTAFVTLEALPVMPNGKVDRRALPPPSTARPEVETDLVVPRSAAEQQLAAVWAKVLRVERVGLHDNYFDLGGDSMLAIQVIARAREVGLRLTPRQVFRHPTVAGQAAVAQCVEEQCVEEQCAEVPGGPGRAAGPVTGDVGLTPIQHWFFSLGLERPEHWNQSVLLEIPPDLDGARLRGAVERLVEHHDALRLSFERREGGWHPSVARPGGEVPAFEVDLSRRTRGEQRRAITAAAGEAQRSLQLEGPLLRCVFFRLRTCRPGPLGGDRGGKYGRLLIVIHHLVVDGVSWRVLLEDLGTAYRGRPLPARTHSFQHWTARLRDYADSGASRDGAAGEAGDTEDVRLPRDGPGGPDIEGSTTAVAVSLTTAETERLLKDLRHLGGARVHEVLLAALAESLASATGSRHLLVDVEGHGREGLGDEDDFSRTVGWFTTLYPVALDLGAGRRSEEVLSAVRAQLRDASASALDYGVRRYLQRPPEDRRRRAFSGAEVVFNYLGSFDLPADAVFRRAREAVGAARDPRNRRTHALEVTGFVLDGRLRILWTFSRNLHRRSSIARLARLFRETLRETVGETLRATPSARTPLPTSVVDEVEDAYPLSPLQQGMLYHSRLAPGSGVYVEQFRLTLEGEIDVAELRRAWQSLAASRAALRTACRWEGVDEPLQVVRSRVELPWAEHDWRGLVPSELEGELEGFLQDDRRRGFVLSQAPLYRLTLIATAESSWELVWTYHHVLLDGWSVGILLEDLLERYASLAAGREPRGRPAGRPYRDYVAWLGELDFARAAPYWRHTLGDFSAPTPLAAERSSVLADGEALHADRQLSLSTASSAALEDFARRSRLTLSTLAQGAWALLLSRYSAEDDVVFGMTVATRPPELDGVESMVGLMINTLPVRARVDTRGLLLPWLRDLQLRQLELLEHEATPLVRAQGWSGVPGDLPLFESLLVFENYPLNRTFWKRFRGFTIRRVEGFGWTSYPLTLLAVPGRRLVLRMKSDRRRFDDTTAQRLLRHVATLLEAMAHGAHEEGRLAKLAFLSRSEQHQLLVEWSASQQSPPSGTCVHQLFEAQAGRTPDSVALVAGGEQLTYAGLDARANRLAHLLEDRGVGPEVVVALCLERSAQLAVGVLGCLKAGGAYLPLDPEHPVERRASLLKEARASVLLGEGREADGHAGLRAEAVVPAAHRSDGRSQAVGPASRVRGGNLAYVLFTSGSTGRPKGVAVEHRQLVNYVVHAMDRLGLAAGRSTLLQPLTVDSSVTAFYPPLVSGGTLHLVERRCAVDPRALGEELRCRPADHLKIAPSHFDSLCAAGTPEIFMPARSLVLGGEVSRWDRVRELCSRAPGCAVFNHYGPTETTVGVLTWRARTRRARPPDSTAPLGRPLANIRTYVLDFRPGRFPQGVPLGVPGELYVGGEALARGYLGQPGRSAESFLPDPFGRPGARLYRTGDRVRHLGDGNVEFLGRVDDQVKLRGFRVEPGEVETALRQHPGVRDCVVSAREGETGELYLAAYVVCRTAAVRELKGFLLGKLPEYMVPAAFVVLDALPLTPHGKVDCRALPAVERGRPGSEDARQAPDTPVEAIVAEIWAEVLGIGQVGPRDSFFALGGHSLAAIRVLARITGAFQVELPLRSLFEAPTVKRLAELVETALGSGQSQAPPLRRVPRDRALPLSYAQQRLWFLDQLGAGAAYNLPEAYRLTGARPDVEALGRSLDEIVRRHEVLRTSFPPLAGEPRQVITPVLEVALPVVDLTALAPVTRKREARRWAAEEVHGPFDLARGPLLRAALLRLGPDEHVLLLTLHHILSDRGSMDVVRRELGAHYRGLLSGRPQISPSAPQEAARLAELPVQYADYAVWQRQWLTDEVLEGKLDFWRERLGDKPAVLELPLDRPRPAVRSWRGGVDESLFPRNLDDGVKRLSRERVMTPAITLMAAFKAMLHRYTGQRDVVVGAPAVCRDRREVEDLVGLFVNTLVMRTDLAGDPRFRDLLGREREVALRAYEHRDLPFERLVEELVPQRDLSRNPLFQVVLTVSGREEPLTLPGLRVRRFDIATVRTRFDLEVHLWEVPEGLASCFVYDADLLDAATAARMARHFFLLLEGAVSDPRTRLSELPLLAPAEHQQLLREWNDTASEYPRERPVHELFEAWAGRAPEAVAVAFEDRQLTYGELDARGNQLAHVLRRTRGLRRVGLCVERSPEMVVGVLGILKAGAAYVPLDPACPQERLAFMLADSAAPLVLTFERLRSVLPERDTTVLCLDSDWPVIAREARQRPASNASAESLAYVMYTSGTTGYPKGTSIRHRSVVRLVRGARYMDFGPGEVFLQLAPAVFDAATLELWGSLLHGARLEVFPARPPSLGELGEWIRARRVTALWLTAALFHQVVDDQLASLGGLRQLLAGGDVLSTDHVRRVLDSLDGVRLVNGYGPTENTTFTCCHSMNRTSRIGATVPIGRPIANSRVDVVDRRLQPVPAGVWGELLIGGDGLAREYLNQPALTAERFVPDPHAGDPAREGGRRLYRTGDVARYLPDGRIEFRGRADHQVKMRGYRVELGEIESLLRRHRSVRQAVVTVYGMDTDRRLAAYLSCRHDRSSAEELVRRIRKYLAARLPGYMVPSVFMVLERLPLTANGKVDRAALPWPEEAVSGEACVAPRGRIERQLVSLWEQVLRKNPIGVRDNFFDLGGHSLVAMRLFALVEKTFGRALPLVALFQAPTVEQMAVLLREQECSALWSSLVMIHPWGERPPFFCVHGVTGDPFVYRNLVLHLSADQPVYGFQARGLDGETPPFTRIEDMAAHYVREMKTLRPHGPYFLGGFCFGGNVAFEIARQLHAAGDETALLALFDCHATITRPLPRRVVLRYRSVHCGMRVAHHFSKLRILPFREGAAYVVRTVRRALGRVMESVAHRVREALRIVGSVPSVTPTDVWDTNALAIRRYAPDFYPGPVTVFRSRESFGEIYHDPLLGWGILATGGVEVYEMPGLHHAIFDEPNVRILAEKLQACLDKAQARAHG